VEVLLRQEGVDVNQATTSADHTHLFMASQQCHTAVVEALLRQ
jgi:hypothetical protein